MATPNPDFGRLSALCVKLKSSDAKACAEVGFRFVTLKYAHSKDLLSGDGAKKVGGRVNAIGTFPVIYTSTDPITATAETYYLFNSFGFAKSKILPRVMVGVEITLAAILDLSDLNIRRRLGVTLKDLAQPWLPLQEAGHEALTQAIGRAAYNAGFEALLLPSVRNTKGMNLNIFPEKICPGSSVKVLEEADLQEFLK